MRKHALNKAIVYGMALSSLTFLAACSKNEDAANASSKDFKTADTEKDLVSQFEKQVTSYNANDYKIPLPNLSRKDSTVECQNGLGGANKKLDPGIFDEPLYMVHALKEEVTPGQFAFAPYSTVTTVVGNVIYEADLDSFNRQIRNDRALMAGVKSDKVLITLDGIKHDTFSHIPTKQGYPVAYLNNQTGLYTSTSIVNDECDRKIGERKYVWQKIDISGKPVSILTNSIPATSTIVSPLGLYTTTTTKYKYIENSLAEYLQSDARQFSKFLKSPVFPKGSYIVVPKNIEVFKEFMIANMNEYTAIDNFKMDDIKKAVADFSGVDVRMVTMIESKMNGYTLYTPYHTVDKRELSGATPVIKDSKGNWYAVDWTLPNKTEIDFSQGVGDLVYMNQTAHDHFVHFSKASLQGLQLAQYTGNLEDTVEMMKAREQLQKENKEKKREAVKSGKPTDIPVEMLDGSTLKN